MPFAADTDIWRFQTHPEVWLVVAVIIGFGYWVTHVLGPKAVPEGRPIVTKRQTMAFVGAVVLLWLSSDWPVHDISEEYLYSVHMAQHLLISLVVPPLFLLAMPEWLARLIVSEDGSTGVWVRRLTRPVTAAVLFNVVVALTHLTWVVNTSIDNGIFHYTVHLIVFTSGLLMWMPIVSPLPELRIGYPGQMMYLFFNSVLPTVPGGFLTFAEGTLYEAYDHPVRLWGMSVTDDQQAAGLIMKIAGGAYIWTLIIILFFRWVHSQSVGLRPEDPVSTDDASDEVLTFDDVQRAFDAVPTRPSSGPDVNEISPD